MGIFHKNVCLINRAPIDLTVTFDGQAKTLTPGENLVPEIVVGFAKNQNPIMGSADPNNPHMSGGRYLVGVKDSDEPGEETSMLTPEEWAAHLNRPCRLDEIAAFEERYGGDPKAKLVTQGRSRKVPATSRHDAGSGGGPANATFSGRD